LLLLGACVGGRGFATGDAGRFDNHLYRFEVHPVQVAAVIVDCNTGERLYEREASRLLRPASTMKLLPTAAIARRQPDGVIETVLVGQPAAADAPTTVTLVGAGDPFLSTDELRLLVGQLAAAGQAPSDRVRVVVVDPLLGTDRFGEGWMWDDEPSSFMPPLSAAPIDGACVTVVAARGADGRLAATLSPVAGDLQLVVEHRSAAKGSAPSLKVSRGTYREATKVSVVGDVAPSKKVQRRISVPDPARHTGHVLAHLLRGQGLATGEVEIDVVASAPAKGEGLRVAMGRSIRDALAATNKPSDNLGAELLLRRLGANAADGTLDAGSLARGLDVVREDLRQLGFNPDMYRLADGSGVSHYNLVSADMLIAELVSMYNLGGAPFEAFLASLPIAGVDGTLAKRFLETPAAGRVRAKTGTISGVSNLAGYVETKSGRTLAFVVLVQNFVGSAQMWRELQEILCLEMLEM
jgi:D-alanyl-D-alanine carboxypeptidase/D-alanyl-D-alanine-endopeptidase (penicillin-binding protein 4)